MKKILGVGVAAVVAAVVVVAVLRHGGSTPVLEGVPADATSVVWVPDLGRLTTQARVAAKALGLDDQLEGPVRSLSAQLGFDLTDPKAVAGAGLAPHGGVAFCTLPGTAAPVVALEAGDPGRLDATVRRVLEHRWARHVATSTHDGVKVTVATGPLHAAAWAFRDRVLVISEGDGATGRVAAAVRTAHGLADDPAFRAARGHLQDAALVSYATGRSVTDLGGHVPGLQTAGVGLAFSRTGATVRGYASLDDAGRRVLAPLATSGDAAALLDRVDPGAILVVRLSGDPVAAWRRLPAGHLPPRLARLTRALAAAHLNPARDVLPLLGHDAILAVRLAPAPDLSSGIPSLDPRRTNPFHYLTATAQVPLTDAAKAAKVLPQVAKALGPALGAAVTRSKIDGVDAFTVRYQLGEGMTFGVVGHTLVAAGGAHAFQDAVARIQSAAGGYPRAVGDPRAVRHLAHRGSASGLLDVDTLLSAVRGLPASSLGGGTFGVIARAALDRITAPLEGLHLVSAELAPAAGGAAFQVRVSFHAQGAGAG